MASINQTVIIRTDLFDMGKDIGLLAAQVAHIHFNLFRVMLMDAEMACRKDTNCMENGHLDINLPKMGQLGKDISEWLREPYLLVKRVPNLEALQYFSQSATASGIEVHEWFDTVYVRLSSTQQKAFPNVLVGISLGPCDADKIRTIVGDLPLL